MEPVEPRMASARVIGAAAYLQMCLTMK
jgi:hypothetical protein